MSRRYARRVDGNQAGIVRTLRSIPGVTVAVDHDDILVGFRGKTFWYEIKSADVVSSKTGEVRQSDIRDSQKKLKLAFTGHYKVVWSFEQILEDLGFQ